MVIKNASDSDLLNKVIGQLKGSQSYSDAKILSDISNINFELIIFTLIIIIIIIINTIGIVKYSLLLLLLLLLLLYL